MKKCGENLAASVVIGAVIGFWLALADGLRVVHDSLNLFENISDVSLLVSYGFLTSLLAACFVTSVISLITSILDFRKRQSTTHHAALVAGIFIFLVVAVIGFTYFTSGRLRYDPSNHLWPLYVGGIAAGSALLGMFAFKLIVRLYKPSNWAPVLGIQFVLVVAVGLFMYAQYSLRFILLTEGISSGDTFPMTIFNILYVVSTGLAALIAGFMLRKVFAVLSKRYINYVIPFIIFILIIPILLFARPSQNSDIRNINPFRSHTNRNIVLISIDTLRYDALGCTGNEYVKTPNIDTLANEGIVFDNCIVPMPLTVPSHISMLTGLIPRNHGVRRQEGKLDESFVTLPGILSEHGYTCGGFVSMAMLKGENCGLGKGFHYYDDSWITEGESMIFPPEVKYLIAGNILNRIFAGKPPPANPVERRADETVDNAIEWLENMEGNNFFCFLHLFDPHWEYAAPEPYSDMYAPDYRGILKSEPEVADDPWSNIDALGAEDIEYFKARYDAEVTYIDAQLGRMFDRLKELDLWDNTMIILTADHGESFGHDYLFDHRYRVYQSCIHVPLIIKPFGNADGQRVDALCSTTDLFPTICDTLDIRIQDDLDGSNLNGLISSIENTNGTIYPYIFCESDGVRSGSIEAYSKTYSVTKDGFKLIYSPWTVAPEPVYRMYNLAVDENELVNIYDPSSPVTIDLTALVQTWFDSDEDPPQNITGAIDRENLRSLQYLH